MMATRTNRRGASLTDLLAFGAGLAVGLAPLLPFFALAPRQFLYGNLHYNLALNPAYRDVLGHSVAMSLGGKVDYLVTEVLGLWRKLGLASRVRGVLACLVARSGRRYVFEQRFVLVLLPLLLLAAFSAHAVVVPVLLSTRAFPGRRVAFAIADLGSMRLRWLGQLAVVVLLAGSVLALRHYPKELRAENDERWPALALHEIGVRVAGLAAGPVLTLAPIVPLEGKAPVYAELVTGPFAWRTSALVPVSDREALRLAGAEDLDRIASRWSSICDTRRCGTHPAENLEDALVKYASDHGYRPEPLRLGFVLWVAG
jgi:hypothetical protein